MLSLSYLVKVKYLFYLFIKVYIYTLRGKAIKALRIKYNNNNNTNKTLITNLDLFRRMWKILFKFETQTITIYLKMNAECN